MRTKGIKFFSGRANNVNSRTTIIEAGQGRALHSGRTEQSNAENDVHTDIRICTDTLKTVESETEILMNPELGVSRSEQTGSLSAVCTLTGRLLRVIETKQVHCCVLIDVYCYIVSKYVEPFLLPIPYNYHRTVRINGSPCFKLIKYYCWMMLLFLRSFPCV